jgi:hypothetical protein
MRKFLELTAKAFEMAIRLPSHRITVILEDERTITEEDEVSRQLRLGQMAHQMVYYLP